MPALRLLGGARIEDDGTVVSGPAARRHPLALLALLATAREYRLSRGVLAGLLWPETPESTARNRLSTVVHQLRAALGPDVLGSEPGDAVALVPDRLRCDVWDFEAALAAGDAATAVEHYTGPFLDGFTPPASAELEHRLEVERRRLRRRYLEALEAWAVEAEDRGQWRDAAERWQRLVDLAPTDARITVGLMRALERAGDRGGALRAAERNARALAEELGAEPDPEVDGLARRLRRAEAPGAAALAGTGGRSDGIAVLPFETPSGDPDAGAIADGIHGDLITELARSPQVPVISRTSIRAYGARAHSAREIARELGVRYMVEGSLRLAGDRLHLDVRLVEAVRDTALWAERYDRASTAEGVFGLQTELARRIADEIQARLGEADRSPATGDLEAYRLHASGRALMDQRSHASLTRAARLFRRAIERDPGYAEPWAALGETLALLISYEQLPPSSAAEALDAARRAIELRPELPEGYVALGLAHAGRRDAPASTASFRHAIGLRDGYAAAHGLLAFIILPLGFVEDGLRHMEKAARLDPESPEYQWGMGARPFFDGSPLDRALEHARRARSLSPGYAEAALLEGQLLSAAGHAEPAIRAIRHGLEQATPETRPRHLAGLLQAYVEAGREEGRAGILEELEAAGQPFYHAAGLAAIGRVDAAVELLRGDDWSSGHCAALRYEPALAGVRAHPHYPELLAEIAARWNLDSAPAG